MNISFALLITALLSACGTKDSKDDKTPQENPSGEFTGLWKVEQHEESADGESWDEPMFPIAFFRIQPMSAFFAGAVGFSFLTCETENDCPTDTAGFGDWTFEQRGAEPKTLVGDYISTSTYGTMGVQATCSISSQSDRASLDGDALTLNKVVLSGEVQIDKDDCDPSDEAVTSAVSTFTDKSFERITATRVSE